MPKKRAFFALLGIVLMLVFALAGCGQKPASTSGKTQDQSASKSTESKPQPSPQASSGGAKAQESPRPVDVKIGTLASGAARYVLDYIKDQKIDAARGINLVPSYMDMAALGNALKLGAVEINSILQPSTAALIKAQGTEVAIFGPVLWSGNQFVVSKKSKGNSIKDLKGQRLGNFAKTSGAYFFTAVLADLEGVNQEKDFKLTYAEAPALNALLQRDDLDIIVQFEPWTTKLIQTGQYRVLTEFDDVFEKSMGSKALKAGLGATREWIQKNPQVAAAVRDIFIEAGQRISRGEDRSYFETSGAKLFGLDTKELIEVAYPRMQSNFAYQWDAVLWKAQENIIAEGKKLGLLPENTSTDVFYKDLK